MKKTLFVMTHPGSGWQKFVDVVNTDSRIEVYQTGYEYTHPDDLEHLLRHPHKLSNRMAIWGDVLLHNQSFTCRSLCPHSYFLFWSSGFDAQHPEWTPFGVYAETYYRLRLSGMTQYFHRAAKALWNPAPGDLPAFFN